MDHLAQLRREGDLLIAAVARADLDQTVPGLNWDARTVATHTGAVHRWSADIVARALPTNETGGSSAFWPSVPLPDTDLPAWLEDGLAALIAVLTDAPADLRCFTFAAGLPPRTFWRRRQAHETAIHRIDVESLVGLVGDVPVDFAQDGLAELVGAFATEPGFAASRRGSLTFEATDGPAWRIALDPAGNTATTGAVGTLPPADARVSGSSSDLYRWAWNRPVPVEVYGDPAAVELWRQIRIL